MSPQQSLYRSKKMCRASVSIPDNNVPIVNVPTICPFGHVDAGPCLTGCMACDDTAGNVKTQCCDVGDHCTVTSTCDTQHSAASYLHGYMMCDNERGEPTFVSCKAGDTCKATNYCLAYRGMPHPMTSVALGVANAKSGEYNFWSQ